MYKSNIHASYELTFEIKTTYKVEFEKYRQEIE